MRAVVGSGHSWQETWERAAVDEGQEGRWRSMDPSSTYPNNKIIKTDHDSRIIKN